VWGEDGTVTAIQPIALLCLPVKQMCLSIKPVYQSKLSDVMASSKDRHIVWRCTIFLQTKEVLQHIIKIHAKISTITFKKWLTVLHEPHLIPPNIIYYSFSFKEIKDFCHLITVYSRDFC
jgi:hypothetical protein